MNVDDLAAPETHALRRLVLRNGDPQAEVAWVEDLGDGAFHLGLRDGEGAVVAVGTFLPRETPYRPGILAYQLRGMAVSPEVQGLGLGGVLLRAGIDRVRQRGAQVLWANARDTAIGFYERHGMTVVGDGFVTDATGLPHHVVILDL